MLFTRHRKSEKEKITALHGILAEDTGVLTTSFRKIPLRIEACAQSPGARGASLGQHGTLVVRNGRISLNHDDGAERGLSPPPAESPDRPGTRLKKRPHSVCYGAVTCTPQEKKSSLKSGPSRSSL